MATSRPRLYAEGTAVSVTASRAEISGILTKHGVERQAWASGPEGDVLQFELEGSHYRFNITKPTEAEVRTLYPSRQAWNVDWAARREAEWRRRWRANVLLLKAKLEFADGVTSTVTRELMPYLVTPGGMTLEEVVDSGRLLEAGT